MSGCVHIIIVNHRTAEVTIDSLRSLSTQVADLGGGRVVVADNDSGDCSAEKLNAAIKREDWSSWADVMPLDRNGGFAYGNNAFDLFWGGVQAILTDREWSIPRAGQRP